MTNASSTSISIAPDFYETLADVVKQAPTALELSRRVRKDGLRSVYLVGCGGSHFAAFPGYDILLREATDLIVHHLTSAQFALRPPSGCDKSSLVVAASHSGATPETVEAARAAKPVLLEPIMDVEVVVPADYLGDVMGDLSSRRGKIGGMTQRGGAHVIGASVPLAEMFGYSTTLRSMSQGRAVYSMQFSHYEEVPKSKAEEIITKMKG